MDSIGVFLFKLFVLALASPFWFPFLKAVWEEMNFAMAEEGGVFGRTPNPTRLREIAIEKATRPDPLVHEPFMTSDSRSAGRRQMRTRATSQAPAATQSSGRRGF